MIGLIVNLLCFLGLLLFFLLVSLKIGGPSSKPLPAGHAVLATLLVTTLDALVALVMDARTDPRARAPDDTG
jgi:hypothetical protein